MQHTECSAGNMLVVRPESGNQEHMRMRKGSLLGFFGFCPMETCAASLLRRSLYFEQRLPILDFTVPSVHEIYGIVI